MKYLEAVFTEAEDDVQGSQIQFNGLTKFGSPGSGGSEDHGTGFISAPDNVYRST
jgi:hypothetical protein